MLNTTIGTTESEIVKIQNCIIRKSFACVLSEIPEWIYKVSKGEIKFEKYGFKTRMEFIQFLNEHIRCKFCHFSTPYEELDEFSKKQLTLNGKTLGNRNKRFYPLFCRSNDRFTQMIWVCNKYEYGSW